MSLGRSASRRAARVRDSCSFHLVLVIDRLTRDFQLFHQRSFWHHLLDYSLACYLPQVPSSPLRNAQNGVQRLDMVVLRVGTICRRMGSSKDPATNCPTLHGHVHVVAQTMGIVLKSSPVALPTYVGALPSQRGYGPAPVPKGSPCSLLRPLHRKARNRTFEQRVPLIWRRR